jgi:hypothetical protein
LRRFAAALRRRLRLAERHLRNARCGRAAVVRAARRLDRLLWAGRYLWLDCLLRHGLLRHGLLRHGLLRRGSWLIGDLRAGHRVVGGSSLT